MMLLGEFIKFLNQCGFKIGTGGGIDASSITSGTIDAARMYVAIDTYANIVANYASAPDGAEAWSTDLRCAVRKNASGVWRPTSHVLEVAGGAAVSLIIGGSGATWSRASDGLITITWTAHGLTTDYNGATCHITQGTLSTGTSNITTGWGFTNFQYVDANTFTVQSDVLEAAAGALGSNTAETYFPTLYTAPTGLLQANDRITTPDASWIRCKSNANNKTIRCYYGDVQTTSNTVTANTAWAPSGSNAIIMASDTTFRVSASSSATGLNTAANTTHKRSVQLANAGDWFANIPHRIQYAFGGG